MASRSFWKVSSGAVGLVALLAILVAVNVIVGSVRLRVDLTQEKLYTLSAGTRRMLKALDRPVTLKLFFNSSTPEVPPQLKNYAREVEDLLKEYRMAGGRRIQVEKYDPKPDSDAEELAQRYGLAGQSLGMFGPQVYFGLVVASGSSDVNIPFLDPRQEGRLEYTITRLIYRVGHPERPVVGLISSLPVMGAPEPGMGLPPRLRQQQAQPWVAFADLKEDYTVRELAPGTDEIPRDINVLLLVHPKGLSDTTLYAIDQFVLRDGRLLAFLDPFSVAEMDASPVQQPFGRPECSSDLKKLLAAWGVIYDADKVVADTRTATKLRGANNSVEENMAFLTLKADNVSKADVATAQLGVLEAPFAGAFACHSSKDLTLTPLLRSSAMAGQVSSMMAQYGAAAVRRDFKPEPVALNLAVRLTGRFPTAFPDGKPKEAEDSEAQGGAPAGDAAAGEPPALKEGTGTVVLVGDVDMLYDRFCVEQMNFLGFMAHQPRNDNIAFFANVLEQLAGSADLIGIRSRGSFRRPFTRVDALEENARKEWQAKEDDLVGKLQETRRRLSEMQTKTEPNQRFILSSEQKEAIARFREEEIRFNKELKDVRKNLRSDIERLGVKVKTYNIAVVPLLVIAGCVGSWLWRRRR